MNTLESLQKASDEELRVMCAELCGWTDIGECLYNRQTLPVGRHSSIRYDECNLPNTRGEWGALIPNYPGSLDAAHEAEQTLTKEQRERFDGRLQFICMEDYHEHKTHWSARTTHATARQRTIALILTKQDL